MKNENITQVVWQIDEILLKYRIDFLTNNLEKEDYANFNENCASKVLLPEKGEYFLIPFNKF
jgi:hypothetical protein